MDRDDVIALDLVFEMAALLSEGMERHLAAVGLTPARAQLLLVLHQRGAVVQRELSQALRCSPRHVTGLVDALEAGGFVVRRRHPTDRRASLVTLTEQGADAAARLYAERRAGAKVIFGGIPAADLATFVAVADRVLDTIRQSDLAFEKLSATLAAQRAADTPSEQPAGTPSDEGARPRPEGR